jgi:hypothetical protein
MERDTLCFGMTVIASRGPQLESWEHVHAKTVEPPALAHTRFERAEGVLVISILASASRGSAKL